MSVYVDIVISTVSNCKYTQSLKTVIKATEIKPKAWLAESKGLKSSSYLVDLVRYFTHRKLQAEHCRNTFLLVTFVLA